MLQKTRTKTKKPMTKTIMLVDNLEPRDYQSEWKCASHRTKLTNKIANDWLVIIKGGGERWREREREREKVNE